MGILNDFTILSGSNQVPVASRTSRGFLVTQSCLFVVMAMGGFGVIDGSGQRVPAAAISTHGIETISVVQLRGASIFHGAQNNFLPLALSLHPFFLRGTRQRAGK